MKVRIKFGKYGTMKFIGHLDIMRFFQKAIRRADIDISYTTGFSPHQIMSFAAPLGVGIESYGEYFDIEVESATNSQDMIERLNRACVEGIEIYSVKKLPENIGNAMATVAAAEYKIVWKEVDSIPFDLVSQIDRFRSTQAILVEKKTKKNVVEMDIKPSIYTISADNTSITMTINASSSGNIKPSLVLEALFKQNNCELDFNTIQIIRLDTFVNIGDAQTPQFVPMDAVGIDITE